MCTRQETLKLYMMLLREAKQFTNYNFRNYAIRKIRDSFRENKHVSNPESIQTLLNEAYENLKIIRRQVTIGQLYTVDKLVIENMNK